LIERLTVGETYFLRNPAHFAALRGHILPSLIQQRRESGHLVLRLWSAGCATGEEPYSLAVTLRELLPDIDAWNIMIMGTDISRESLDYAAKGNYGQRSFRKDTPAAFRRSYFRSNGKGRDLLPEIRRMVHFAYLNLVEDSYPTAATFTVGLDLIICRNVTIYFDQETTRRIARRFHESLVDDGWLIVGHSEPLGTIYEGFEPRNFTGAVIYQKSSDPGPPSNEIYWPDQPTSSPQAPTPDLNWISTALDLLPAVAPPSLKIEAQTMPQAVKTAEPVEESAPEIDENSALGCYEMGKALADQMQWAEAHEWLHRAVEIEPLLIEAHFAHALIHQHQGDDQVALKAIKRTLYIDRNFTLGHFNLGVVCQRLGRIKEAIRAWKNARDLLQDTPPDELLLYGDGLTAGHLLSTLATYLENATEDET
jgi:chemotaxis protein methyltransferase CheR